MLSIRNQNLAYEKQSKFIQDRISSVEKNFGELCNGFALYACKVARLRDAGDEISKIIKGYSNSEDVNKTLSCTLLDISSTLSAIEEYRNARAHRLEAKVVNELSQYEGICRHFRGEIKHTLAVRESEITRKKALDKIKDRNPLNRQQIIHAESELLKASTDMNRTIKDFEEQTDAFERQKLQNIKQIMKTFFEIEIAFQIKALELYTVACKQLNNIDCESDLHVFQEMRGSCDVDYRTQFQSTEGHINIHKQAGLGSIASLLSQDKPKPQTLMLKTSDTSEDESEEISTEESSKD